jgi:hypothetical protein
MGIKELSLFLNVIIQKTWNKFMDFPKIQVLNVH